MSYAIAMPCMNTSNGFNKQCAFVSKELGHESELNDINIAVPVSGTMEV